MPWEGYNFEDAIILSRAAREATTCSRRSTSTSTRSTPATPSSAPRRSPATSRTCSRRSCSDLDERGIIRIGAEVGPGDVLVGKVTPKGETELTPEERLLRAIFGEKAREVRDTSLKVPARRGRARSSTSRCSAATSSHELAAGREPAGRVVRRPEAQDQRAATSSPAATATRASSPRSSRSRTCPTWPTARPSTSSSTRSASRAA